MQPTLGAPSRELLDTFRGVFVVCRWLLVTAETVETILLLVWGHRSALTAAALLALFLYNVASLILVHRVAIRRVPVLGLIVLDLLFVAFAGYHTGGSSSPFLGQFYLIIFVGALFYGLAGGVLVGAVSALLTILVSFRASGSGSQDIRDLVPYFLLTGAFSGYLVACLKTWFRRHQTSVAREHEQALQERGVRREMELAEAIQQAALPACPPRVPGLEIAARSEFARHVGGDFHLFLESEERFGLVLGDVSGKGAPAALTATGIVYLLPAIRPLDDPPTALRRLDQSLGERLPPGSFVTLTLAEIAVREGTVRFWVAGHPPALLWRARERRVVEGCPGGMPLGLGGLWNSGPGEPDAVDERPFESGDVFLLFSDGVTETRNADNALFETERVAAVLAHHAEKSAEAIADALLAAVHAWGEPTDDVTILVCRRLGEIPPNKVS